MPETLESLKKENVDLSTKLADVSEKLKSKVEQVELAGVQIEVGLQYSSELSRQVLSHLMNQQIGNRLLEKEKNTSANAKSYADKLNIIILDLRKEVELLKNTQQKAA